MTRRGADRRTPLRHGRRWTLRRYLDYRLGRQGGRKAWFNFFLKPFGAASFAQFWRLWNPLYGYFLYCKVYRPLSRVLPRAGAVLLTFVLCGFLLHDVPAWVVVRRVLPPGATIAFTLFGLGVLVSEALHMDLSRWPLVARAALNVAYLAGCVLAMLLIVLAMIRTL